MTAKISFGKDVPDDWKKAWLLKYYPEAYRDFYPEGPETASPEVDKLSKKGGKGGK